MNHRIFLRSLYTGIAFVLFFFSFLFFSFSTSWYSLLERVVFPINKFNPIHIQKELTQKTHTKEVPTRIRIASVGIDLPIVVARVVNGYWELSDNTASYGLGSGEPGRKGNMVIFAHARIGLFLPLQFVSINDKIFVTTGSSHTYGYTVVDIKHVYPTDAAVVGTTSDETLTLFTCSGFMDSKRLIVVAKPETNN